jgi:hypothetical protein
VLAFDLVEPLGGGLDVLLVVEKIEALVAGSSVLFQNARLPRLSQPPSGAAMNARTARCASLHQRRSNPLEVTDDHSMDQMNPRPPTELNRSEPCP